MTPGILPNWSSSGLDDKCLLTCHCFKESGCLDSGCQILFSLHMCNLRESVTLESEEGKNSIYLTCLLLLSLFLPIFSFNPLIWPQYTTNTDLNVRKLFQKNRKGVWHNISPQTFTYILRIGNNHNMHLKIWFAENNFCRWELERAAPYELSFQ